MSQESDFPKMERATINSGDAVQKFLRSVAEIAGGEDSLKEDALLVLQEMEKGAIGVVSDSRLDVQDIYGEDPLVLVMTVAFGEKRLPTFFVSKNLMIEELAGGFGFDKKEGLFRGMYEMAAGKSRESIRSSIRDMAFGLRLVQRMGGEG